MYWLKCNLLSRIVIRIYLDSDNFEKELNEQEIVIVNREAATLYNMLVAKSPLQFGNRSTPSRLLISFNFSALLKSEKRKYNLLTFWKTSV